MLAQEKGGKQKKGILINCSHAFRHTNSMTKSGLCPRQADVAVATEAPLVSHFIPKPFSSSYSLRQDSTKQLYPRAFLCELKRKSYFRASKQNIGNALKALPSRITHFRNRIASNLLFSSLSLSSCVSFCCWLPGCAVMFSMLSENIRSEWWKSDEERRKINEDKFLLNCKADICGSSSLATDAGKCLIKKGERLSGFNEILIRF